jgi:hypothetical protein
MSDQTTNLIETDVLPSSSDPSIKGKFAKAIVINDAEQAVKELSTPKLSRDKDLNDAVMSASYEVKNCEEKITLWKGKLTKAKQRLALLKKAASL